MTDSNRLSYGNILLFWAPLAMTWLMMASEGPFITAIVARLPDPKINLAAHGVAIHIAILIEAPIIMIMSASTALAVNRTAFIKLRNFTYALNGAITLFMAILLFTPGMDYLTLKLIGLPEDVARLVHTALIILLPWPAAIGYRRFFQGLLIRGGQTRRVAYGTITRISSMAVCGLVCYHAFDIPGALISATSLSMGVVVEAVAARFMAIGVTRKLLATEPENSEDSLRYRGIIRFYYPLALTSTLGLAVHPLTTFFMAKSRFPLESLAVLPVVNSLSFIFIALGLSYLEVVIALLGDKNRHYPELRNFAYGLCAAVVLCLGLIAFTPFSGIWFHGVSGLIRELSDFAVLPLMLMVPYPALTVYLCLQRAVMVKAQKTAHITWATLGEIIGVVGTLVLAVYFFDMIGAVAASLSLCIGRAAGTLYMVRPCRAVEGIRVRAAPEG